MLNEGNHKVKIVGCFTGESSEKNTPYFGIEFETLTDEPESINWIAYLTNTEFKKNDMNTTVAKENLKTLAKLGFIGNSLSDLSDTTKKISELFEELKDTITVNIEHEIYRKEDGTEGKTAKVKWVNIGFGPNKFDHKQAVVKFKALNLDGQLLAIRKSLGKDNQEVKKQEESFTAEELESDDVPF